MKFSFAKGNSDSLKATPSVLGLYLMMGFLLTILPIRPTRPLRLINSSPAQL